MFKKILPMGQTIEGFSSDADISEGGIVVVAEGVCHCKVNNICGINR